MPWCSVRPMGGLDGSGRAAALLGRSVGGAEPEIADLRWAAGLLHDLVVWGLDRDIPDTALRPVESRLSRVAVELAKDEPVLAALVDWWLAAVVGLRPQQLWYVHPLPDELVHAMLPGDWPPNLGGEVKRRRFAEDRARLGHLATTVPVLSQVAKAQAVVREFNAELKPVLVALERAVPPIPRPGAASPRKPRRSCGRRGWWRAHRSTPRCAASWRNGRPSPVIWPPGREIPARGSSRCPPPGSRLSAAWRRPVTPCSPAACWPPWADPHPAPTPRAGGGARRDGLRARRSRTLPRPSRARRPRRPCRPGRGG